MKKFVSVLLCFVMTVLCFFSAQAAEFTDMYDLYQYWQSKNTDGKTCPYPDYVCGVWVEDGAGTKWVVAVTKDEAGEAGKQELLDSIENSSNVSFTYQSYSFAELWEIYQSLIADMGDSTGIFGMEVDETENCILIDYNVSNPNAEEYIKNCLLKYGDRVRFTSEEGFVFTEDAPSYLVGGKGEELAISRSNSALPVILICAGGMLVLTAAFVLNRRCVRRLVSGGVESSGNAGVKEQIKLNAETPLDSVFEKIKRDISEK